MFIGKNYLRARNKKNIHINQSNNNINIIIDIQSNHVNSIIDFCEILQKKVKYNIEHFIGLKINSVNINVISIASK